MKREKTAGIYNLRESGAVTYGEASGLPSGQSSSETLGQKNWLACKGKGRNRGILSIS